MNSKNIKKHLNALLIKNCIMLAQNILYVQLSVQGSIWKEVITSTQVSM